MYDYEFKTTYEDEFGALRTDGDDATAGRCTVQCKVHCDVYHDHGESAHPDDLRPELSKLDGVRVERIRTSQSSGCLHTEIVVTGPATQEDGIRRIMRTHFDCLNLEIEVDREPKTAELCVQSLGAERQGDSPLRRLRANAEANVHSATHLLLRERIGGEQDLDWKYRAWLLRRWNAALDRIIAIDKATGGRLP